MVQLNQASRGRGEHSVHVGHVFRSVQGLYNPEGLTAVTLVGAYNGQSFLRNLCGALLYFPEVTDQAWPVGHASFHPRVIFDGANYDQRDVVEQLLGRKLFEHVLDVSDGEIFEISEPYWVFMLSRIKDYDVRATPTSVAHPLP